MDTFHFHFTLKPPRLEHSFTVLMRQRSLSARTPPLSGPKRQHGGGGARWRTEETDFKGNIIHLSYSSLVPTTHTWIGRHNEPPAIPPPRFNTETTRSPKAWVTFVMSQRFRIHGLTPQRSFCPWREFDQTSVTDISATLCVLSPLNNVSPIHHLSQHVWNSLFSPERNSGSFSSPGTLFIKCHGWLRDLYKWFLIYTQKLHLTVLSSCSCSPWQFWLLEIPFHALTSAVLDVDLLLKTVTGTYLLNKNCRLIVLKSNLLVKA